MVEHDPYVGHIIHHFLVLSAPVRLLDCQLHF
nr:MAG TPA: hypothetical protein [Bacteriophage sp.]DAI96490.1 MAG TPA: hypothetical protein [Caudoviricetes sp.]DAN21380.1 MAG TPA_asm: hypothetical protein [Bacteriophage sp.]